MTFNELSLDFVDNLGLRDIINLCTALTQPMRCVSSLYSESLFQKPSFFVFLLKVVYLSNGWLTNF